MINRRKGVGGEEFGIGFAVSLPAKEAWNGDFMMQGGGGGNGVVAYPLGASYAGDKPALMRGFAVASTDTGHKAKTGPFDFSFMRDQQAYLDFAYLANAEVAGVAKQIIAHYYAKPATYSYFVGCSTGGREGMILSQRYPTVFNGIVSGDPAMRTGLSNLAIGKWIPVAYNQAAPKDASGKPQIEKFLTDERSQAVHGRADEDSAMREDGVADGMIFDPLGCDFDPAVLACKAARAMHASLPRSLRPSRRRLPDRRIRTARKSIRDFFTMRASRRRAYARASGTGANGLFGPYPTATEIDVDKEALHASDPLVEPASTNLSTFSGQRRQDHSFSMETAIRGSLRSIRSSTTNRWPRPTAAQIRFAEWSRMFLVPGMGHCGGGPCARPISTC